MKPCVEVATKHAMNFLVQFGCSSFLWNEPRRKWPGFFTTYFTPFFIRQFAAVMTKFHEVFILPTGLLDILVLRNTRPTTGIQNPRNPQLLEKKQKKTLPRTQPRIPLVEGRKNYPPPFRTYCAINPSKNYSAQGLHEFRTIQPEIILQKYFGAMTKWPLLTSIAGSMLQKR